MKRFVGPTLILAVLAFSWGSAQAQGYRPPRERALDSQDFRSVDDEDIAAAALISLYLNLPMPLWFPNPFAAFYYWAAAPEPWVENIPVAIAPEAPLQTAPMPDTAVTGALPELTMTTGEWDALRVAIQRCWNVGSLSTEALSVTVVVNVSMGRDGRPDPGSIRMLDYVDGNESAARQAYETARRAIIRCGANGYDLPIGKYQQWREIEMTFNPMRMRIK